MDLLRLNESSLKALQEKIGQLPGGNLQIVGVKIPLDFLKNACNFFVKMKDKYNQEKLKKLADNVESIFNESYFDLPEKVKLGAKYVFKKFEQQMAKLSSKLIEKIAGRCIEQLRNYLSKKENLFERMPNKAEALKRKLGNKEIPESEFIKQSVESIIVRAVSSVPEGTVSQKWLREDGFNSYAIMHNSGLMQLDGKNSLTTWQYYTSKNVNPAQYGYRRYFPELEGGRLGSVKKKWCLDENCSNNLETFSQQSLKKKTPAQRPRLG